MIVAVDFDGVLVEDQFPNIGPPKASVVNSLWWAMKQTDTEFILWTSRVDDRLQEALDWCEQYNLTFTAVNAGAPSNLGQYGTNPRKIYADKYLDDRSIGYTDRKAVTFLNNLVRMSEMEDDDNG